MLATWLSAVGVRAPARRVERLTSAARHAAAAGAAAAVAVRAPSVVPEEVPVLRLQLARMASPRRGAAPADRQSAAKRRYLDALRADLEAALPLVWGRPRAQHLHRRRHAQPVLARRHRPPARRHPRPAAAGARLRDHAGSQPRHLRARPLPRLPRRRRHAAVDRRAELRRRSAAGARPRARRGAGARRGRGGARGLRHLQPRPDVRAARPDAGAAATPTWTPRCPSRRRTCRSTT